MKTETNTIYTVNALNEIIKTVNNGQLDKEYQIDWQLYRNWILIMRNGELHRIGISEVKTIIF
jgi:hypothetical protein